MHFFSYIVCASGNHVFTYATAHTDCHWALRRPPVPQLSAAAATPARWASTTTSCHPAAPAWSPPWKAPALQPTPVQQQALCSLPPLCSTHRRLPPRSTDAASPQAYAHVQRRATGMCTDRHRHLIKLLWVPRPRPSGRCLVGTQGVSSAVPGFSASAGPAQHSPPLLWRTVGSRLP